MGYSIRIVRYFILLLFVSNSAFAQSGIPTGVGVIDQLLYLNSLPKESFIFVEERLGVVTKYPAQVELLGTSHQQEVYIIGATVPNIERNLFHFSVFTKGQDANLNAMPVSEWTSARLLANTPDEHELRKLISETENQIKFKIGERDAIESELDPLEEEVANIGRVDEITDIQLELSSLEDFALESDKLNRELTELLKRGRTLIDPNDIDLKRKNISEHLTKAAQVTSVADRLNRRREDAALQNFRRKLNAVREMKQVNMQDMAKEVLRLRKKRRELESRLNLKSTDFDNDQF